MKRFPAWLTSKSRNLLRRPPRPRVGKPRACPRAKGGPLSTRQLAIRTDGTLVFVVRGQVGWYSTDGHWHAAA
jgi:hypothetical protein